MKALSTCVFVLACGSALAQSSPAPLPSVAPPSETALIDDREAAPPDAPPAVPPLGAEGQPLPEKIMEPPPAEAAPAVSIRTDSSGDVVEEYRLNGTIYMVKVRPTRGLPYTLMDTNGDGRLDAQDGEGPVRPVYWTLYEWN